MEFGDYPTERSIPWKPIALGAGGILLVVILVIILFRVLGSNDTLLVSPKEEATKQADVILDSCQNAENIEGCLEAGKSQAAIVTGDTTYCGDLEGAKWDDCILGAAREYMDLKACTAIQSAGVRTLCEDAVNTDLAKTNNDPSFCSQLSTEEKIVACQRFFQDPVTAENCLELDYETSYCHMLSVAKEAGQKQDHAICDSLPAEDVGACKDLAGIDDADFDGLETAQEAEYGTDPYNSDTDGDGYGDGVEVQAGYNPNGEGKL